MRATKTLIPVVTALVWFSVSVPARASSIYSATCDVDQEISSTEMANADSTAINFVQSIIGGNSNQVYSSLSNDAQSESGAARVAADIQFVDHMGPYENIHVIHTYLIQVKGGGGQMPPMVCGKSLVDPDRILVSMLPISKQFYVQITAHTINNDWAIFVWLIPEQGTLKVRSFNFNASAISGYSSQDLAKLASYQNSHGNSLNAALLYETAEKISDRGPNVTLFWKQQLVKEVTRFSIPPAIAGSPPFIWRLGNQSFEIQSLGIIGVGGKLGIVFDRHLTTWPDDATVKEENQNFISAVIQAYPEFGESFGLILAKVFKPDDSGGLGSVYEYGKGFDP